MADKNIFIGIGGSGVDTVAMLKYKLYARTKPTDRRSRLDEMRADNRFLFVDTDKGEFDKMNDNYKSRFENGNVNLINENELVNLSDINPKGVIRAAKNDDSEESYIIANACSPTTESELKESALVDGAGTVKLNSRIAFIRHASSFYDKIKENISILLRAGDGLAQNEIKVWVISSCCGGTGSGILQDVLYYTNMALQQALNGGNPKVGLVLYMPRLYHDRYGNSDTYWNNAQATFRELEVFSKWSFDDTTARNIHSFTSSLNGQVSDVFYYRPFRFCIPVDYYDENNVAVGNDKDALYASTAEMLDLISSGAGGRRFSAIMNNIETECQNRGLKYVFMPMGYAAINKPTGSFNNYMTIRFKYELLRYGIIGTGIDEDTCKSEVVNLLSEIVQNSYFEKIADYANKFINKHLNDSKFTDEKNKYVKKIDGLIRSNTGGKLVDDLEKEIAANFDTKDSRRKKSLVAIENMLLRWIEDRGRQYGLVYVQQVLRKLDNACEQLYKAYKDKENTKRLAELASTFQGSGIPGMTKSFITGTLSTLGNELMDSFKDAENETIIDKITGANREQVQNHVKNLRKWVLDSTFGQSTDELFELLNDLSHDDTGVIDRLRDRVSSLIDAASYSKAQDDFMKLAKTFYGMSANTRTKYIPDITEFSDGSLWKNDNLFSQLYGKIIASNGYDDNTKLPVPNLDAFENIFSEMSRLHEDLHLDDKGYFVDGRTKFFVQPEDKRATTVISDIVKLASELFQRMIDSNDEIQNKWLSKSLENFIKDLTAEEIEELRNSIPSTTFFSFDRDSGTARFPFSIRIAPKFGALDTVLPPAERDDLDDGDNPSCMIRILAKPASRFEEYALNKVISDTYSKDNNKVKYHFHQAFAQETVIVPKKVRTEVVTLARYLLMETMKGNYSGIMVEGTGVHNMANFAQSPILLENSVVKIAKEGALSLNATGDKVILSTANYDIVNISAPGYLYTELVEFFKSHLNSSNYSKLIKALSANVDRIMPGMMMSHFNQAHSDLHSKLEEQWNVANTGNNAAEKCSIGGILDVLDNQLRTFEQFLI